MMALWLEFVRVADVTILQTYAEWQKRAPTHACCNVCCNACAYASRSICCNLRTYGNRIAKSNVGCNACACVVVA